MPSKKDRDRSVFGAAVPVSYALATRKRAALRSTERRVRRVCCIPNASVPKLARGSIDCRVARLESGGLTMGKAGPGRGETRTPLRSTEGLSLWLERLAALRGSEPATSGSKAGDVQALLLCHSHQLGTAHGIGENNFFAW